MNLEQRHVDALNEAETLVFHSDFCPYLELKELFPGERVSLHLSHHLTSVRLYCDLADVELATDLFIQQAGGYQRHDLPFPRRERRVTVPERPYLASRPSVAWLRSMSTTIVTLSSWSAMRK